ncbi:hypothetical protein AVEN_41673-1 [Araneus ventricosus]|uniref:Uncharacterized protein n=1 Tax=Araneus ventricosus TaxID=182803 RepID=A0A4Y2I1G8_ARAVE|nr:hypothetical protein AVEN_41673-1 [Araneus ventricosus]
MVEEIDNVFENDQMYIRKPTDTNRCVCKERIGCKSRPFSNLSTKIGVCASSLRLARQESDIIGPILVHRLGCQRFAFRPRDVNGFFTTERSDRILVRRSFRRSGFTLGSDIFLLRTQLVKRSACAIFVFLFEF